MTIISFPVGATVKKVDLKGRQNRMHNRTFPAGLEHIIKSAEFTSEGIRYRTDHGAWFANADFEFVREPDRTSLGLLRLNAEDEDGDDDDTLSFVKVVKKEKDPWRGFDLDDAEVSNLKSLIETSKLNDYAFNIYFNDGDHVVAEFDNLTTVTEALLRSQLKGRKEVKVSKKYPDTVKGNYYGIKYALFKNSKSLCTLYLRGNARLEGLRFDFEI